MVLEKLQPTSVDYEHILKCYKSSFLDPKLSSSKRVLKIEKINNELLERRYKDRKREISESNVDGAFTEDMYVFSVETEDSVSSIARVGLSSKYSSSMKYMGVSVFCHPDVAIAHALEHDIPGRQLVLYKAVLGNIHEVESDALETCEPLPRFHSVMSTRAPSVDQPVITRCNNDKVVIYDIENERSLQFPRQILPYAVLTLSPKHSQSGMSKPMFAGLDSTPLKEYNNFIINKTVCLPETVSIKLPITKSKSFRKEQVSPLDNKLYGKWQAMLKQFHDDRQMLSNRFDTDANNNNLKDIDFSFCATYHNSEKSRKRSSSELQSELLPKKRKDADVGKNTSKSQYSKSRSESKYKKDVSCSDKKRRQESSNYKEGKNKTHDRESKTTKEASSSKRKSLSSRQKDTKGEKDRNKSSRDKENENDQKKKSDSSNKAMTTVSKKTSVDSKGKTDNSPKTCSEIFQAVENMKSKVDAVEISKIKPDTNHTIVDKPINEPSAQPPNELLTYEPSSNETFPRTERIIGTLVMKQEPLFINENAESSKELNRNKDVTQPVNQETSDIPAVIQDDQHVNQINIDQSGAHDKNSNLDKGENSNKRDVNENITLLNASSNANNGSVYEKATEKEIETLAVETNEDGESLHSPRSPSPESEQNGISSKENNVEKTIPLILVHSPRENICLDDKADEWRVIKAEKLEDPLYISDNIHDKNVASKTNVTIVIDSSLDSCCEIVSPDDNSCNKPVIIIDSSEEDENNETVRGKTLEDDTNQEKILNRIPQIKVEKCTSPSDNAKKITEIIDLDNTKDLLKSMDELIGNTNNTVLNLKESSLSLHFEEGEVEYLSSPEISSRDVVASKEKDETPEIETRPDKEVRLNIEYNAKHPPAIDTNGNRAEPLNACVQAISLPRTTLIKEAIFDKATPTQDSTASSSDAMDSKTTKVKRPENVVIAPETSPSHQDAVFKKNQRLLSPISVEISDTTTSSCSISTYVPLLCEPTNIPQGIRELAVSEKTSVYVSTNTSLVPTSSKTLVTSKPIEQSPSPNTLSVLSTTKESVSVAQNTNALTSPSGVKDKNSGAPLVLGTSSQSKTINANNLMLTTEKLTTSAILKQVANPITTTSATTNSKNNSPKPFFEHYIKSPKSKLVSNIQQISPRVLNNLMTTPGPGNLWRSPVYYPPTFVPQCLVPIPPSVTSQMYPTAPRQPFIHGQLPVQNYNVPLPPAPMWATRFPPAQLGYFPRPPFSQASQTLHFSQPSEQFNASLMPNQPTCLPTQPPLPIEDAPSTPPLPSDEGAPNFPVNITLSSVSPGDITRRNSPAPVTESALNLEEATKSIPLPPEKRISSETSVEFTKSIPLLLEDRVPTESYGNFNAAYSTDISTKHMNQQSASAVTRNHLPTKAGTNSLPFPSATSLQSSMPQTLKASEEVHQIGSSDTRQAVIKAMDTGPKVNESSSREIDTRSDFEENDECLLDKEGAGSIQTHGQVVNTNDGQEPSNVDNIHKLIGDLEKITEGGGISEQDDPSLVVVESEMAKNQTTPEEALDIAVKGLGDIIKNLQTMQSEDGGQKNDVRLAREDIFSDTTSERSHNETKEELKIPPGLTMLSAGKTEYSPAFMGFTVDSKAVSSKGDVNSGPLSGYDSQPTKEGSKKPISSKKFHGRTLLKGPKVPSRRIPLTPLCEQKSAVLEIVPKDPRTYRSRGKQDVYLLPCIGWAYTQDSTESANLTANAKSKTNPDDVNDGVAGSDYSYIESSHSEGTNEQIRKSHQVKPNQSVQKLCSPQNEKDVLREREHISSGKDVHGLLDEDFKMSKIQNPVESVRNRSLKQESRREENESKTSSSLKQTFSSPCTPMEMDKNSPSIIVQARFAHLTHTPDVNTSLEEGEIISPVVQRKILLKKKNDERYAGKHKRKAKKDKSRSHSRQKAKESAPKSVFDRLGSSPPISESTISKHEIIDGEQALKTIKAKIEMLKKKSKKISATQQSSEIDQFHKSDRKTDYLTVTDHEPISVQQMSPTSSTHSEAASVNSRSRSKNRHSSPRKSKQQQRGKYLSPSPPKRYSRDLVSPKKHNRNRISPLKSYSCAVVSPKRYSRKTTSPPKSYSRHVVKHVSPKRYYRKPMSPPSELTPPRKHHRILASPPLPLPRRYAKGNSSPQILMMKSPKRSYHSATSPNSYRKHSRPASKSPQRLQRRAKSPTFYQDKSTKSPQRAYRSAKSPTTYHQETTRPLSRSSHHSGRYSPYYPKSPPLDNRYLVPPTSLSPQYTARGPSPDNRYLMPTTAVSPQYTTSDTRYLIPPTTAVSPQYTASDTRYLVPPATAVSPQCTTADTRYLIQPTTAASPQYTSQY